MKCKKAIKTFCLTVAWCCFSAILTHASHFGAYSLLEAERRIKAGQVQDKNVEHLGGITDPLAVVYDATRKDLILVGHINPKKQVVTLNDFVVALRAILTHETWPLVSIDKDNQTARSKLQKIRFEGGIQDSAFGTALLDADILLKNIGLGNVSAEIWGVGSFFDMLCDHARNSPGTMHIRSRFWFVAEQGQTAFADREGVMCLDKLVMGVESRFEMTAGEDNDHDATGKLDDISRKFAHSLSANFNDLRQAYPQFGRLESLFRLVGLATGVHTLTLKYDSFQPDMTFWLEKYRVVPVRTPETYPLLEKTADVNSGSEHRTITLDGGLELRALMLELKDGSISALRDMVIGSRPSGNPLTWKVPLDTWKASDFETLSETGSYEMMSDRTSTYGNLGCTFDGMISPVGKKRELLPTPPQIPVVPGRIPDFKTVDRLSGVSSHVGGVMLENVAEVTGDETAGPLDMANAKFSFIVDGENTRLDPHTFRKFVTALWAVYFGNDDPGISIDPIAPGAEKHMVRYIGRVINTDLGRVMREADYLMKKWAVGTGKPDIKGFKSPMDYAAETGLLSIGAWSRFWFVPKDMRFRRSGNMLLFEGGRMTVQTEYMYQGVGSGSDPANRKFAGFFTEHYDRIAAKYPVYQELFEYAKMVSLAKYLKESGVPLLWFLMANKDLVITEDSISTVDALIKNSRQFAGVQIEGGVELYQKGQYINDLEAIQAVNDAISRQIPEFRKSTPVDTAQIINEVVGVPFSFTFRERNLSVLPQHSSSSGKDFRGRRYQTDIAVREAGYQLGRKSLAQVQHDIFRLKYAELIYQAVDSNGNLSADKTESIIEESWKKAEAISSGIVENLRSLLNKDFKNEALFKKALGEHMSKSDFNLLKTLITKHAFYNTNLELVRCFYQDGRHTGVFGKGWDLMMPYELRIHKENRVEFQGYSVPKYITLIDRISGREEKLTFDAEKFAAAAYVPNDIQKSTVVGVFTMTDGSFHLLDKIQNEFEFNPAGFLTGMIFSDIHQIHVDYRTEFSAIPDTPPYNIEPAGDKWFYFRNVYLPENVRIRNLGTGRSEILVFTQNKAIIGYEPADPEKSGFSFLALMTDLSYRLADKNNNEYVFNPSGEFEKTEFTGMGYLVQSISSGNYKIEFGYSPDKNGEPMIARASLRREGESDAVTLSYIYGTDGHLSRVLPIDGKAHNFAPES
jgi:hypothetical protein